MQQNARFLDLSVSQIMLMQCITRAPFQSYQQRSDASLS